MLPVTQWHQFHQTHRWIQAILELHDFLEVQLFPVDLEILGFPELLDCLTNPERQWIQSHPVVQNYQLLQSDQRHLDHLLHPLLQLVQDHLEIRRLLVGLSCQQLLLAQSGQALQTVL